MTVVAVINVIYQSMIILWGALGLIALAQYAIKQGKDKEESSDAEAEAEAESWFARIERKLDLVLKMNGCDVSEEIIERPSESTYDLLLDINDKFDTFVEPVKDCDDEKVQELLKNLNFSCEVHKYEAPETEDKP